MWSALYVLDSSYLIQTSGKHYWYDVKEDMDCETFFPVFLLYNGGKLNGFGWAMMEDLPSDHYEHPGVNVIGVSNGRVFSAIHEPSLFSQKSTREEDAEPFININLELVKPTKLRNSRGVGPGPLLSCSLVLVIDL